MFRLWVLPHRLAATRFLVTSFWIYRGPLPSCYIFHIPWVIPYHILLYSLILFCWFYFFFLLPYTPPPPTLKFSLKFSESGQCRFRPNTFFWPLLSMFSQCQDPVSLLSQAVAQQDRSQFWTPSMLPGISCHVLISLPSLHPPWGEGLLGTWAWAFTVPSQPQLSEGGKRPLPTEGSEGLVESWCAGLRNSAPKGATGLQHPCSPRMQTHCFLQGILGWKTSSHCPESLSLAHVFFHWCHLFIFFFSWAPPDWPPLPPQSLCGVCFPNVHPTLTKSLLWSYRPTSAVPARSVVCLWFGCSQGSSQTKWNVACLSVKQPSLPSV